MQNITESNYLQFKNISAEEKSSKNILGRLFGPIASCVNPTRNNRTYSEALWDKVFSNNLIIERFKNGGIFGEINHPADGRTDVDLEKVAVVMPEPPYKDKDGSLIGCLNILNTPAGKVAYELAKAGYKFGISSRGTGDIMETYNGSEVDPDTYVLSAFDLVELPAVESARLTFVESLNNGDNKNLNESLKHLINSTKKDSDKKIMKESLKGLGINLDGKSLNEEVIDGVTYVDFDESLVEGVEPANNDDEYSDMSIEDMFKSVCPDCQVFDENGIMTIEAKGYFIPVADKYFDGSIDRLRDACSEAGCFGCDSENCADINGDMPADDTVVDEPVGDVPADTVPAEPVADVPQEPVAEPVDAPVDGEGELEDELQPSNDGEQIITEFTEALKKNKKLELEVISLQEKLSARNAGEVDSKKEINELKESIVRLTENSKKAKVLEKQISELNEANEELYQALKERDDKVKELSEKLKLGSSSKVKLEESYKQELNTLQNSYDKLSEQFNSETQSLKESIINLEQDGKLKESNFNKKLEKAKTIIEQYKSLANLGVDKYIDLQAMRLGVTMNEIKNRLPQSYGFADIDKVCEDIQGYSLNINSLPFEFTESPTVKITPSDKPVLGESVQQGHRPSISEEEELVQLAESYINSNIR